MTRNVLRGPVEFHVARRAREHYEFDEMLFSSRGNVVFANFQAARSFAQKMNDKRDVARHPERTVSPAHINAMGLIDEILHMIVAKYRQQNPTILSGALSTLDAQIGQQQVDAALLNFARTFPGIDVYRGELTPEQYLSGSSEGIPNREILLEEMLMLWLSNMNPAYAPYGELFDHQPLEQQTSYPQIIDQLQAYFDDQPGFGADNENLISVLRSPALTMPQSLSGQLQFLLQRVGVVLGPLLFRLLTSIDIIKEEDKFFAMGGAAGGAGAGAAGPGPIEVASFHGQENEVEAFTQDREWMPRLVLIAKNAFVWLDQLSKRYNRPISTLDQIPDEELDFLSRSGVTGLWLIGLWERSAASKRIKQMMGNQDAVASAYSLYDYQIAHDLGGDEAVSRLRERAWQRGIRLASDMVPNHVGIDGKWVIEHPDWFLSLPYSPYPSYSFNGPDLSSDDRVGVFLEDHYYDRTDASVVFKRVDKWSGDTRYIYHGNDGTSMPWNDTAQINYLNAEAREAVIQTILHVARNFPIIRFDAAMTLAKKHIERLWFPEPGSGGAIPSRSEHAMTRAQFDALMPNEFWREVVDRCAVEAPDTLLLAEAFWLMEGYFVRTLGMHRVYNSAFMHMLRDEDNAKYRTLIKNTLEFDPKILQRYVNFMNNPDEKTAVEQFGKDDKYFGVCTVMATLPGLPMIGHGQFEGFAEKYGMEYRRAYWDEQPDQWLIQRHERQIFPLLHKRYLFAGAENFRLYDFFTANGHVYEDVLAYSNRFGDERGLVIYHNRYAETAGWIRESNVAGVQTTLGEGLGLRHSDRHFTIFRDQASGLEYIRSSKQISEEGIFLQLGSYQLHVFIDFREIEDNEWQQYAQLNHHLDGRGVPSINEALHEIFLQPIHAPFNALVNADLVRQLAAGSSGVDRSITTTESRADTLLDDLERRASDLFTGAGRVTSVQDDATRLAHDLRTQIAALLDVSARSRRPIASAAGAERSVSGAVSTSSPVTQPPANSQTAGAEPSAVPRATPESSAAMRTPESSASSQASSEFVGVQLDDDPSAWGTLLSLLVVRSLGKLVSGTEQPSAGRLLLDEWLLGKQIAGTMRDLGKDEGAAWRSVDLIRLLLTDQDWATIVSGPRQQATQVLDRWFRDAETQRYLQVNRHSGIVWFNKESFETLLAWLLVSDVVTHLDQPQAEREAMFSQRLALVDQMRGAAEQAGYQVEALLRGSGGAQPTVSPISG